MHQLNQTITRAKLEQYDHPDYNEPSEALKSEVYSAGVTYTESEIARTPWPKLLDNHLLYLACKSGDTETVERSFSFARSMERLHESNQRTCIKQELVPKIYQDTLTFDTRLLRSALFSTRSGERRVYADYTAITAHGKDTIEYKGEELRQDDLRVLQVLVKQLSGQYVTNAINFKPLEFCTHDLGWSGASTTYDKLKASLTRLRSAQVRVTTPAGSVRHYAFVDRFTADPGMWFVHMQPKLLSVFSGLRTHIPCAERLELTDGLTSWLHGFVCADSCFAPFKLSRLRELSDKGNYEQSEFNRHLKVALDKLAAIGLISAYTIDTKTKSIKIKKARRSKLS